MIGSLIDFIEVPKDYEFQLHIDNQEKSLIPVSPLSKFSRKKTMQYNKKKRTMSGVQQYKASDKSLLFEKFSQNYPLIEKNKKQSEKVEIDKNISNRKPISASKLSSLFYGQNPSKKLSEHIGKDQYGGLYFKMEDQIAKNELKREHNLLRAIVRTKMNQQQKIVNTHYEDSFNRMSAGLKKIKIRQIAYQDESADKKEAKTNRSLQLPIKKRTSSHLSNKQRIQFQNCLSWTKRRNKNGSFYADKLGKNSKIETDNKSVENRKSMLQYIHQRSASGSFIDML